ncbi:hypothetical protein [Acidovorax sp. ACV01]|uniref:hypothetical protein n=1 Tax=Acidovorax sp. ACV01 TaxID=2769311 RepID=UPI001787559E|nr:hypothetical protein [Acidovorax sp. ACV01]MBD9391446.1 hypothetical protein [Acidovorax sp. ACV01]
MNAERQLHTPSITTLERFVSPPGLDGSDGVNRLAPERKSIDADTDVEAVRAWISSLNDVSDVTVTSYRTAAEKLLNWSCFARGKPLSSLNVADLEAFVEFLAAPYPSLDWICKTRARDSLDWRPFAGPLSQASVRMVISAMSSLFRWLSVVGYASMPSISGKRRVRDGSADHGLTLNISAAGIPRTFSREAWAWIKEVLIGGVDFRTRLTIELLYFANLKLEEIRRLRLADCVAPSCDCVAWRVQVDSMTNCLRCVYALPPLGDSLSQLFEMQSMSVSTSLQALENRPKSELLFDSGQWLRPTVTRILRRSADLAAANGDNQSAKELRDATLMYFRGALESHSGGDSAFVLGFVANARGCRSIAAQYLRRTVLDNEATNAGWMRLAEHWRPYSERLSLEAAKAGPATLPRTLKRE